jgi:signal transduction histidine kinase
MKGLRGQLTLLMSSIVLLTLAGTMVVMLVVARHHLYADGIRQATMRAQAFAFRAGFATLVAREDSSVPTDLLLEVVSAPGTLATELVDASGERLAEQEVQQGVLSACNFSSAERQGAYEEFAYQIPGLWCVSTPIRQASAASNNHRENGGELLGRLRIASDTSDVEQVLRSVFVSSLLAGMLLLGVGAFMVIRAASRVSTPLIGIVETMRAAEEGDATARAPLAGPEEVVTISRVYNRLMERIDRQASELEAKVEERTEQLQVAMDAAQAAERAKSAFLANVSHEMKTPIHVIEANARDVLSELEFVAGADRAREHVGVMLAQSGELALRVSQILAFARADAGGYAPIREEFLLIDFAEDVRVRSEPLARQNRNAIEVQVAGEYAFTDRDMLLQIVSNLVVNACKFTEAGRVRVNLRRLATFLEVEVSDTGCGIPASQQALVWQEFRQVDMGEGRKFGGFGLGLAIVRRLTEMLDGEVEMVSEVGQGTCILVRVPAVP